jgi:hypothetical protein
MGKQVVLAMMVILVTASVSSAFDFWGWLFNYTDSSGSAISTGGSSIPPGGGVSVGASQTATASSTSGFSGVGQLAGVAGTRSNGGTLEQSSAGGLGQIAVQTGEGSAQGMQIGGVSMNQTSPDGTASQSHRVVGIQSTYVTGDAGSAGVSGQLMLYEITQVQN